MAFPIETESQSHGGPLRSQTPDEETAGDLADSELYELDEHRWIERQIEILRSGNLDQLDRVHLIDTLTDMASRDRREFKSRLTILLIHLLKMRNATEAMVAQLGQYGPCTAVRTENIARRYPKPATTCASAASACVRGRDPPSIR